MGALKDFPRLLTEIREQRNLTKTKLAKLAGISVTLLSHYEAGVRQPKSITLVRLAQALQCSTDALLGLDFSDDVPLGEYRRSMLPKIGKMRDLAVACMLEAVDSGYRRDAGLWGAIVDLLDKAKRSTGG